MDGDRYKQFFLQPEEPWHRRYEALRAVFVERHAMAEVAERLHVAHGTVRNWASEFRSQRDRGETPPFFASPRLAIAVATRSPRRRSFSRTTSAAARETW